MPEASITLYVHWNFNKNLGGIKWGTYLLGETNILSQLRRIAHSLFEALRQRCLRSSSGRP